MKIEVSEELHRAWPGFRGAAVFATVRNTAYNAELWKRIEAFTALYREKYTLDSIKEMPAIQATRQAYKKCGKDPSRYRPSSEALCRRILRGIPLYQAVSTGIRSKATDWYWESGKPENHTKASGAES